MRKIGLARYYSAYPTFPPTSLTQQVFSHLRNPTHTLLTQLYAHMHTRTHARTHTTHTPQVVMEYVGGGSISNLLRNPDAGPIKGEVSEVLQTT